jgi:hypothetical protein
MVGHRSRRLHLYDALSPDVSPTIGRKAKGKRQEAKGKNKMFAMPMRFQLL